MLRQEQRRRPDRAITTLAVPPFRFAALYFLALRSGLICPRAPASFTYAPDFFYLRAERYGRGRYGDAPILSCCFTTEPARLNPLLVGRPSARVESQSRPSRARSYR